MCQWEIHTGLGQQGFNCPPNLHNNDLRVCNDNVVRVLQITKKERSRPRYLHWRKSTVRLDQDRNLSKYIGSGTVC